MHTFKQTVSASIAALLILAAPASADFATQFVGPIEAAHATGDYYKQEAVSAAFDVSFGGSALVSGTMLFDVHVGKARLELDSGTTIVFDGQRCWVSPQDAEVPGPPARFHVLTWPYFAAAMHKLRDPGSQIADAGVLPLTAQQSLPAGKLTFGAGVGDAPDDWYLVFADPTSQRLHALAYIVTYGTAVEEASKQPSIVFYDAYADVQGVPMPTRLTFYFWDAVNGRSAEPKGVMSIRDGRFVQPSADAFVKPAGAREDVLPGVTQ